MTSDRPRGFTLLEMLVVLLVAGLALVLTTQAMGQYQRAHTRAIASERAGREQRLGEAWLRASVRGLHAVPPPTDAASGEDARAPVFEGDARGFTGVTLAPVLAQQGTPMAQRWQVVDGAGGADRLQLEEGGQAVPIALPRAGRLRFHYMDPDGDLHDRWPPAQGTWAQLPEVVLLELKPPPDMAGNGAAVIAASVLGPRDPRVADYEYRLE